MDKIDQWLLDKRGKFSASVAWKLLSKGKSGEMFGDGAWTYIKKMAAEMMTHIWDNGNKGDEIEPMLHGKVHEYPAYQYYIQQTNNFSVKYFGDQHPIFITHPDLPDEFGCSPDAGAITDDGTISLGLEIKCPFDSLIHLERLGWETQWDLYTDYPAAYTQIQASLMCTGAEEWHFISFDERQIVEPLRGKIVQVLDDFKLQDNLNIRVRQAIKEKYRIISRWMGTEVRNREEFMDKAQKMRRLNKKS